MSTAKTNHTPRNPYVGPKTFTEEQGDLYFGREREASELLARVMSERLVLFYAQSGAGKSSLINTRLIPKLREAGYAVLPVARVGGGQADSAADAGNVFLLNLIQSIDSAGRESERLGNLTLSQFLAGLCSDDGRRFVYDEPADVADASQPSSVPTVLIVDQFEELITAHPDRWMDHEGFFRQLNQAMLDDPNLWMLFAFREDYLASIEPYAPLMTDRMRARFYMKRMGVAAAIKAVREPAELGGRPFAPGVAERLVDDLRQVRVPGRGDSVAGQYVEPVQLQVVCLQLWKNLEDRPVSTIGVEDLKEVGDVNRALIGFYEDVLAEVITDGATEISERQLRTWFERELITPEETRALVRQGKEITANLPNAMVQALQDRFLVRPDSRRAGDTRIELVHDRFVRPILDSNRAWRAQNQHPLVLAAEVWLAEGRRPQRLLSGDQLRSAMSGFEAARRELNETECGKIQSLLEASETQERKRKEMLLVRQMAVLEREKYISEMGWGVIFPAIPSSDVDRQREQDAIVEALQPLLEHRKSEAIMKRQELYREFIGADGFRPGDTADSFLTRYEVGPGEVDPLKMPHYLLLVGDPEVIPFEFQYAMDLQFAVGRIHFETTAEYRSYADSVVRAETGANQRPRRVAFFAPQHPFDHATQFSTRSLVVPLMEYLEEKRPDWSLTGIVADYATKARLGRVLGGNETPALFFSASHGTQFLMSSSRQIPDQGALLCQDWPGSGPISQAFYFSADDLADQADVFGLVAFVYASCGAGTPRFDDYDTNNLSERRPISECSFLARLPLRLLSHPQGGALAFIGYVERGWLTSFKWSGGGDSSQTYVAAMERLLDGYPVGAALEPFNRRYAELAARLAEVLNQERRDPETVDQIKVSSMRVATTDARNWIVIGDPAVRLMVSGLRPNMGGLKVLYQAENLRREGDRSAAEGDMAGAEEKYRAVLELSPWLGIDPSVEARAVAARAQVREAKDLANRGQLEEATSLLEEARRSDPEVGFESLAPLFVKKAKKFARLGHQEQALNLVRRAKDLDPLLVDDPETMIRPLVALYHRQEGRSLAKEEGAVDAAVTHYEQALELDPTLKSEMNPSHSLDPLEEASRYAAAYFEARGAKVAEQGDVLQAAAAFRRALELDPSLKWDPEEKAARLVEQARQDRARADEQARNDIRSVAIEEADLLGKLWFNGIDASTGQYWRPPISAVELAGGILGNVPTGRAQRPNGGEAL